MIGREGFKFETRPRSARGTVGGTNKPQCARCQASECSDGVGKGWTGTRGTEVVVIEEWMPHYANAFHRIPSFGLCR